MSETHLSKEDRFARNEQPTMRLRWHRSFDGVQLSEPKLQQLWEVEDYYYSTMYTKRYGEWRDIEETSV